MHCFYCLIHVFALLIFICISIDFQWSIKIKMNKWMYLAWLGTNKNWQQADPSVGINQIHSFAWKRFGFSGEIECFGEYIVQKQQKPSVSIQPNTKQYIYTHQKVAVIRLIHSCAWGCYLISCLSFRRTFLFENFHLIFSFTPVIDCYRTPSIFVKNFFFENSLENLLIAFH